ncbi:MAG: aminoglycoside 3'-phosphotransferase [Oscillospiraceae bacterium]|nr:aminoglycoside 3'-phosphotransferase [Oscillospiraceae bacterium]
MTLTPITADLSEFPDELHEILRGARLYDSSCSQEARVIFIDRDSGYFLKSAPTGSLRKEAELTRYFHEKGLAAGVTRYVTGGRDWLLTEKLRGDDCTAAKYLERPERLCDALAERLFLLHAADCAGCPEPNRTASYLADAESNFRRGHYDLDLFPDSWGFETAEQAHSIVLTSGHLLQADTLLHGDYCLPNVILDDWRFSGFVDLGSGGVGDRHVDLFWGAWTLNFNLKTDKFRQRFFDAYGRGRVDEARLRVVAAVEVFG